MSNIRREAQRRRGRGARALEVSQIARRCIQTAQITRKTSIQTAQITRKTREFQSRETYTETYTERPTHTHTHTHTDVRLRVVVVTGNYQAEALDQETTDSDRGSHRARESQRACGRCCCPPSCG